MKLNHISFPSLDVSATAAFFERYLECKVTVLGTGRVLTRQDFDIVLEDGHDLDMAWPRNFHMGIELQSLDELQSTYRRFVDDGIRMETELITHPRGSRFFCWIPGGFMLEVNTREDAQARFRPMFASTATTGR